MVAIVAGNTFGVARSSAATLGASGQLGSAAMGRGNDRVYVNAATGNLVIDRTDEVLLGVGPDAAYSLTYNSQDSSTPAGTPPAWNLGTYRRIADIAGTVNTAGSTAKRVAADGSASLFTYDSAKGYYVSQDGPGGAAELRFAGGVWTWTAGESRMTERYQNVIGYYLLTSASDADGNSQSYTYDASGFMTRITEANGDYTAINWTGGRPDAVTTSYTNASGLHTLTRVRYVFDSLYRLTSATVDLSPEDHAVGDGHSYTTTYGYDGSSLRVAWIAQTDGSRLDIGYTQSGANYYVTSLTEKVANGVTRVTGLFYDLVSRVTTITDPLGGVTKMSYDAAGNLTRLVRPAPAPGAAARTTDFEYSAAGDVVSVSENGLATAFQYDANGNLKLTRDAAGNTVTRTYGTRNERLTETRWRVADPDGAGPQGAGTPATTRYAYDTENHLRFVVSAEGHVTEYRYNGPGQLVSTIAYAGTAYNLAELATDAALSEAALQDWTGTVDRSNAERVDTSYDARGNVNTVTRYNSLDGAGAGVASAGYSQDTYVYDQTGLLLSRVNNASPAQEIFAYDGLGRLISATDMTNATTTTTFNDATSTTTVSYANGLTIVSVYDKAGEVVSVRRSGPDVADATATAAYDGLGRVRVETDATNRSTYHVYDAASRKVADVSADGAVTEYGYDSSDRLVRKIEYLTKLDSNAIALLSGLGAGGGGGIGKGGVRGPGGLNLVQNGSFEQPGPDYTDLGNGERYGAELPGWLKSNAEFFEQVATGALGVSASDGSYWLDLDSTSQLGLAPTGGNLLLNAGFESFGVDNQSLPNWTKLNAQPFQQLASNTFGIAASEGGFWLDLDSTIQTGTVTTGSNLIANGSFDALGADSQSLPNWTKLNPQPYQQMTFGTGGIAPSNGAYWLDLDSTMQTGWTTVGSEWLVNGSFETGASDHDMTGWVKVNPEGYQRLPSGADGIAATNGNYWLDLDSTRQTGTIAVGGNLVNNGSFETAGPTDQSMPGWVKFNAQPFQQTASGTGGVAATNGTYWLDLDSKYQTGWAGTGANWLVNGSFEQMGSSDQQLPGWTKANPEPFQQLASGTDGVVATDGTRWLDLDSQMQTGWSPVGANLISNGSFESSGASYGTTSYGRLGTTPSSWTSSNALFEQVASGSTGVSPSAGTYWLDLDAPTRVGVGNNLLTNGSFEQVTGTTAPITGGRAANAMPGWTKSNIGSFETMTSGTGGVTTTDGGYWLDLDVAGGVPQGQDILVNGSFEQVNGTGTPTANGALYTSMPGWTISNSQGVERVPSGTFGTAAADGSYFLDMDGQGGVGSNADIRQTIVLATNQSFTLSFSYANSAGMVDGVEGPENSGALYVYWNGNAVGIIGTDEAAFGTKTFTVSGLVGSNTLRFQGVGTQDGRGVSLDNVKLVANATQGSANLNVSQTVTGLTAGQILQLSFDHASRAAAGSGSFDVIWNNQVVASYSDLTTAMQTSSLFVTAVAGSNIVQFRGTGTADNVGASLDNVRLLATQAGAPANIEITQKISNLTAGFTYRLQFDYANRTTAASGSFDVLWDGAVIASVTNGTAAMQTMTIMGAVGGGDHLLTFRGTGTADDVGASIDNVRVTWMVPSFTPGNMDISQAVPGLAAGQKMELSFDHANRTISASGSFDVLWNGEVIDSISSTGTAMLHKTYYVTAAGGNDVLRFRGTGTANDFGASIDNVRLLTAEPVYSTGNMDVRQTVQNLTAGQSMQLKFDYASRTGAPSGSFEVLWNGVVIDTVTDGTVAMKPRTYTVTAVAGDNVIGFRGIGAADDVGASIDNVQLYATQPVMTHGNMHIKQTVNGLIAGQMMQLQFDYANRTGAASGSFEVLWNGAVVATVSDGTTTMQTRTLQGPSAGGSNVLEFRGTGTADDVGASIDNVRLMTLQPVYAPGNMDISQTVENLSANQALQLQFEYASRAAAGSGSFEVLWNDNVVATVADGTLTMQTRTIALTALAGNNILRFRGTGTADDVGASLDNVRLMATQPVFTPGNMIVSQSVTGLDAGQTLQLDFDYANRTGTPSGTFEVLWNGTVIDTVVDGASVMKTKTYALTAIGGTNMLGFRGAGTADDAGASLDNVRLRLTQPVSAPGNMAISQTINDLAAGQPYQLLFDHANRTGSASGGFDVYWNGTRLEQIADLSSTMRTSSYVVTARAGANLLEFRGTGAADEAGASLDNVRLLPVSGTPPVAPSPTDPLFGLRPAPAIDGDVWTWNVYDSADRIVQTIDSAGRAVTFVYDGDSRLIGSKAYANALGADILAGFKTSPPTVPVLPSPDATTDRPTRSFYDADGRVIGSLDGVGGFSRIYYDAAGRKVREVAYANAVASHIRAGGTFADLAASVGTHAADRRVDYVHDDQGLLRFIVDAAGRPTEMVYDTAGAVVRTIVYAGSIAAPAGGADYTLAHVQWQLAATGLSSDGANRITRAVYDTAGRTAFTIDAEGAVTASAYGANGVLVKTTRYSAAYSNFADTPSLGAMQSWSASQANATYDRATRHVYDAAGRLAFTIDAEGFVTERRYDAADRLQEELRYSAPASISDGATKAGVAGVVAPQAASARTTAYAYDAAGRLTDITDAEGAVTHYVLDAFGQATEIIDAYETADAASVKRVFDAAARIKSETRAYGTADTTTTTFGYDAVGNLITVTDGRNFGVTREYDALGRVVATTTPVDAFTSVTTRQDYNNFGEVVKTTDGRNNAAYFYYDKLGRQTLQLDAEGFVTETAYAASGQYRTVTRYFGRFSGNLSSPPAVAGAPGATTRFDYDRLGRITKVTDAENNYEQYWLDGFGDRIIVRNKLGGLTHNVFDRRGLLKSETLPVGSTRADGSVQTANVVNSYQYYADGNLKQKVEAAGLTEARTTNHEYDKLGRLVRTYRDAIVVTASDLESQAWVTPEEKVAYDKRGNVTWTVDAGGGQTFFYYDDADRKIASVDALGTLSTWTYDANGNALTARVYSGAVPLPTLPGGTPPSSGSAYRETRFDYDRANRLIRSTVSGVTSGAYAQGQYTIVTGDVWSSSDYDAAGNVIRQIDLNGNKTWFWYDKLGRKSAQVDAQNYLTVWDRDAEGNVAAERRFAGPITGTFDQNSSVDGLKLLAGTRSDDRLTTFVYDKNGRRLSETRHGVAMAFVDAAGALSQSTQNVSVHYEYNGLGEVTKKTESTGDFTVYEYDSGGRQFRATSSSFTDFQNNSVQRKTENFYDGLNNLTRSVQNDARVARFTYGAGGRLATMTDAANFTRSYGYDAAGRIVKESYDRLRAGAVSVHEAKAYRYDLLGRQVLEATALKNGASWDFGDAIETRYNGFGEVTGKGVHGLWQETFDYDGAGRIWRSTAGDGTTKIFLADRAGNTTLTIASAGTDLAGKTQAEAIALARGGGATIGQVPASGVAATIGVYDGRGQLIQERNPYRQLDNAGTLADVIVSKGYNAFGEVVVETDARNCTTEYDYNTMGRLTQKRSPFVEVTDEHNVTVTVRPVENYFHDESGRLVASQDANGFFTRRTLLSGTGYEGAQASVLKEFHADNGVVETRYDVFGNAREVYSELAAQDPNLYRETRTYDAMDRLVSVTHRGQLLTDNYGYDGLGQRIEHWNSLYGSGATERTQYDAQGRVVLQTDLTGAATRYEYAWQGGLATNGLGTFGGWQKKTFNDSAGRVATDYLDFFGRAVQHTDFGNNVSTFGYNAAGQLATRTNPLGDSVYFTYFNTGLVSGQTGSQGVASYGYDKSGNRVRETFNLNGVGHRDASASYDGLGRMVTWSDTGYNGGFAASNSWKYDANGNVRAVETTYVTMDQLGNASLAYPATSNWYVYDNMNRVTLTGGSFDIYSGQIERGAKSVHITYNAAGERKTATYSAGAQGSHWVFVSGEEGDGGGWADVDVLMPEGGPGHWVQQNFTFAGDRREDYIYRADGTLVEIRKAEAWAEAGVRPDLRSDGSTDPIYHGPPGTGALLATYSRDAMGRILNYKEYGGISGTFERHDIVYDAAGRTISESSSTYKWDATARAMVTNRTNLSNTYVSGLLSTQHQQNLRGYDDYAVPDAHVTYSYDWRDGAVQSSISTDKDYNGTVDYSTSYYYDGWGRLSSLVVGGNGPSRYIMLSNDENGMIVDRIQQHYGNPSPRTLTYFFGGQQMGQVGNDGTDNKNYVESIADRLTVPTANGPFRNGAAGGAAIADFEQSYDWVNGTGGGPGTYTVMGGETLPGIAAALWGDANLWYLIAEANGLGGGESLAAGRTLTIPDRVTNIHNNASTFRVYDPSKALGNVDPTQAKPVKAPRRGGCGIIGTIILVAVAVAVTAITYGALTGPTTGLLGTVLAGAASGAAGSVASQGFGVATGLQDKFSWKGVAMAALSGAVGGGVGNVLGKGAMLGSRFIGDAVRGAASSALTQGIGVAVGLQKKFDFAAVAAAGVGAGVLGAASRHMAGKGLGVAPHDITANTVRDAGFYANQALSGAAGAIASAATRSLANGSDFGDNLLAALPDVIGSTIGNLVADPVVAKIGEAKQRAAAEREQREYEAFLKSMAAIGDAREASEHRFGGARLHLASGQVGFGEADPFQDIRDRYSLEGVITGLGNGLREGAQDGFTSMFATTLRAQLEAIKLWPGTTDLATQIIDRFVSDSSNRVFVFDSRTPEGAAAWNELLTTGPSDYFQSYLDNAVMGIINKYGSERGAGGNFVLREGQFIRGARASNLLTPINQALDTNFWRGDMLNWGDLRNGAQLGDLVGTLSTHMNARVENGMVIFEAENRTTLTSAAYGNLSGGAFNRFMNMPTSGPYSPVIQRFRLEVPVSRISNVVYRPRR